MNLMCPACSKRLNALVLPSCIVCRGRGLLTLNPDAVREFGGGVVARAIVLGLEARARVVEIAAEGLLEERAQGVRDSLAMLTDAGLLCGSNQLSPGMLRARAARVVAGRAVRTEVIAQDERLVDAEPYRYQSSDQPGRRGAPVLSHGGHPSHLARAADPAEPFAETSELVVKREGDLRRAAELAAAADIASIQVRRRRAREAPPSAPLFDLPR